MIINGIATRPHSKRAGGEPKSPSTITAITNATSTDTASPAPSNRRSKESRSSRPDTTTRPVPTSALLERAKVGTGRVVVSGRLDRDSLLRRLLGAGDAVSVLVALVIAVIVDGDLGSPPARLLWGLVAIPLMIILFKLYGLYDRDVKRISHSTVDDLPWIFHATVIGALVLSLFSCSTPMGRLDHPEIVIFGLGTMTLVTGVRLAVRSFAA